VLLGADYMDVSGLAHDDGSENFNYYIDFRQFQISQYSDGLLTLIMNPVDSLYLERSETTKEKSQSKL